MQYHIHSLSYLISALTFVVFISDPFQDLVAAEIRHQIAGEEVVVVDCEDCVETCQRSHGVLGSIELMDENCR